MYLAVRNVARAASNIGPRVSSNSARMSSSNSQRNGDREQKCKKTHLYDLHVRHGGRMVDFAGHLLPVQYGSEGIGASHAHTRHHVSIFDVSHMMQTKVHGRDRYGFVESVVVSDIKGLKDHQGTLTVMTTESGGIIDDLIVTNTVDGYLYVVSNAGCVDKDTKHLKEKLQEFKSKGGDAELEILAGQSLLAIQGPGSVRVLQPLVDFQLTTLLFMTSRLGTICGIPACRVARCGYTGEDGFEVSVPGIHAEEIVDTLLNSKADVVKLAGLGARDSLRLEAGLCLYGNDMDETTTPVEASLSWLISKRRRESADFPGAKTILEQLRGKPSKRRVGFVSQGPPARAHTTIVDSSSQAQIGQVTSGCPSPTLQTNISMGYVNTPNSKAGTKMQFDIRKKLVNAVVTKMPFVPHKYFTRS